MLLKFITFFTMRFYLKGFYRLLWLFKGVLRKKDDIYELRGAYKYNDLKIKLNHTHYYQWMMACTNYYGFGIRAVMGALLKPGDTFVDVGANIGYISIIAQAIVGRTGFVIAFEPDSRAIRLYKDNMAMNNICNYALIEKVCSDSDGVVTFNMASHLGWSTALEDVGALDVENKLSIPQCKLDSVIPDFAMGKVVKLIKIDVEGYEPYVLGGAYKIIEQTKAAFIIEVNNERLASNNHSIEDILTPFSGSNYVYYWIVEHRNFINSVKKVSLRQIKNIEEYYRKDGDVLIIPKDMSEQIYKDINHVL